MQGEGRRVKGACACVKGEWQQFTLPHFVHHTCTPSHLCTYFFHQNDRLRAHFTLPTCTLPTCTVFTPPRLHTSASSHLLLHRDDGRLRGALLELRGLGEVLDEIELLVKRQLLGRRARERGLHL